MDGYAITIVCSNNHELQKLARITVVTDDAGDRAPFVHYSNKPKDEPKFRMTGWNGKPVGAPDDGLIIYPFRCPKCFAQRWVPEGRLIEKCDSRRVASRRSVELTDLTAKV